MKISKFLFALLLTFVSAASSFAQKMTPETIVTKHIASIGTTEKRSAIKNQFVFGDLYFKLRGSATPVAGKVVIASTSDKSLWGMNLTSTNYPQDRFSFDGDKVQVGFPTPGTRSLLGNFIRDYNEVLRDGLLGGALTSSWTLLDLAKRNPKLSYEGTKEINGKETYVLGYVGKKGSDLNIKMYFDQKDFRHVRTEYIRVIASRQGAAVINGTTVSSVDSSSSQGEERYKLVEDFSDFKNLGGLMLPSIYKISYTFSSNSTVQTAQRPNREAQWEFNITNFSYNQQIDDASFNIEAK
jgi:hypothetical protein